MKALLIDPKAKTTEVIEVEADENSWKSLIDPACLYLGHLSLWINDPCDLGVVFDDQGELVGFEPFSLYSRAHGYRMPIYGRALVIGSSGEQFVDLPEYVAEDLLKPLDIVFDL